MDNVLDIRTGEPERATITIDGEPYELNTEDDLQFKDTVFLGFVSNEIEEAQKSYTDKRGEKLEQYLNKAVGLIVRGVPDEVVARLSDGQKLKVVEVFSNAPASAGPPEPGSDTE